MRFLQLFLVISLASLAVSCKTYDRQQYSYSYRAPVHVVHDKATTTLARPDAPQEEAVPSATAPTVPPAQ